MRTINVTRAKRNAKSETASFAGLGEALSALPATAPVAATKPDDKAAERELRIAARAVSKTGYNGASLAIRSGNPKLTKLLANIAVPKQCTDEISQRDRSYLRGLRVSYPQHVDATTGIFNPVATGLDAGVASHLGHHKLATVLDGNAVLTAAGLKLLATA